MQRLAGGGNLVKKEEEQVKVIRIMGLVSWIAGQILPRYRGHGATANVEMNTFKDVVNRVSPYAEGTVRASGSPWKPSGVRNDGGDEYRSLTVTEVLPPETLTPSL